MPKRSSTCSSGSVIPHPFKCEYPALHYVLIFYLLKALHLESRLQASYASYFMNLGERFHVDADPPAVSRNLLLHPLNQKFPPMDRLYPEQVIDFRKAHLAGFCSNKKKSNRKRRGAGFTGAGMGGASHACELPGNQVTTPGTETVCFIAKTYLKSLMISTSFAYKPYKRKFS